jgi:predicted AAA+ superfamily ATPase
VQHVPELASYLQVEVDRDPRPGRFILTGSENFSIHARFAQSLAGRTAILRLLPPSLGELERFPSFQPNLARLLQAGSYPRPYDSGVDHAVWLEDYTTTYVQRDVRNLLNIGDLERFMMFLRLAAGRTAQEQNLHSLGGDVGISSVTARAWMSVLEASFIDVTILPWREIQHVAW